jgi:hypothetical protein
MEEGMEEGVEGKRLYIRRRISKGGYAKEDRQRRT